jgi:peptidoglycan/LPS O-acetylase OafA/YrhL
MKSNAGDIPGLIQSRYPALDGLRGAATLAVFGLHFGWMVLGYNWLSCGWAGVDFFFVLSGFLITGGLADTLETSGALKRFYARRALRIFPLFYTFWIVVFVLCALHLLQFNSGLLRWPLYIANLVAPQHMMYLRAISRLRLVHSSYSLEINHFWSLCVEEQFYLAWPLVLLLVRGRAQRMVLCVAGVALSLTARCLFWSYAPFDWSHSFWAYRETYLRLDGLLLGSFVALLIRGKGISSAAYRNLRLGLFSVPALLIAAYSIHAYRSASARNVPFVVDLGSHWMVTFALTIIPLLATGILLFCLTPENPISRALQWRPLRALGTISYGFYILHDLPEPIFIQLYPALHARHLALLAAIAWFCIVCGLAWLSFRYLETPFLRLKDRYKRHTATS